MPTKADQALTVRDVAAYLNVDEKTIYRLAQRARASRIQGRRRLAFPERGPAALDRPAEAAFGATEGERRRDQAVSAPLA